jgi:large-conductance mechanosensitive channel
MPFLKVVGYAILGMIVVVIAGVLIMAAIAAGSMIAIVVVPLLIGLIIYFIVRVLNESEKQDKNNKAP